MTGKLYFHHSSRLIFRFALHDLGIDEMQSFLEGYGITDKKLLESMPLIRALILPLSARSPG